MHASVAHVQQRVHAFNRDHPVGTRVRYWFASRGDEPRVGRTRSQAWCLGGHTPVVLIEGARGARALSHVQPIDEEE